MIRLKSLLQLCFSPSDRPAACDWLLSVEQMQRVLDRERMRSDRGASSFSLVEFAFESACKTHELAALAKILRQRIRATDNAGLLNPRRLGVVLPETSAEGAWKLANDISALIPEGVRRPDCHVYTYPWDDDSDQSLGEERESEQPKPESRKAVAGSGRRNAGAHSMNAVFVKPLPAWKRAIDVASAIVALAILGPLMLVVAAAIKLTSPGPVFFRQWRDTIGGRRFQIYKFRTMTIDAEEKKAALLELSEQDGPAFKIAKDPRVTRLGRFLRSTSIDELPQFLNVLLGDMTLVGPRAMDSKESSRCALWQRRRLDVTAGITCIWQVRGRSSVPFAEWMRMDLRYIRGRSMTSDLKLIAQTVPAVLIGRGAC